MPPNYITIILSYRNSRPFSAIKIDPNEFLDVRVCGRVSVGQPLSLHEPGGHRPGIVAEPVQASHRGHAALRAAARAPPPLSRPMVFRCPRLSRFSPLAFPPPPLPNNRRRRQSSGHGRVATNRTGRPGGNDCEPNGCFGIVSKPIRARRVGYFDFRYGCARRP